jgi:hypothetical protein
MCLTGTELHLSQSGRMCGYGCSFDSIHMNYVSQINPFAPRQILPGCARNPR